MPARVLRPLHPRGATACDVEQALRSTNAREGITTRCLRRRLAQAKARALRSTNAREGITTEAQPVQVSTWTTTPTL